MAHFKCPTSVEIRTELARTATGKLQKFKLRQPYWEGREKFVNYPASPQSVIPATKDPS